MSLLIKKRDIEKQRLNGLNDPVNPLTQKLSSYGWPAMNTQVPASYQVMPDPTYEISSMPCYSKLSVSQVKRQTEENALTPVTDIQAMNSGDPIIVDKNLPPGAYYDTPVYLDSLRNLSSQQTQSPATNDQLVFTSVPQQNRCSRPGCPNCKNNTQAN